MAIEADGEGADDPARLEMLRRFGTWTLAVADPADRVRGLFLARRLAGTSLQDALTLRKRNSTLVAEGTRVEIEWLRDQLAKEGVSTTAAPPRPSS